MMDPDKKLEKMIRELDPTMSKEKQDSMKTTIKDIRKLLKIKVPKKADGGMMNKNLKPVDKKKNPGLAKLPTDVRNKMGYMASGGMARRDKDEEKALKGIEKQQESQARRAEQAHKDVREYSRKKARKMKKGGMVLEIGLRPASKEEMKMAKKMKDGGSVEGQRLTRAVPPQKGPNSQGMRGTGSAIRGTKFKGVF